MKPMEANKLTSIGFKKEVSNDGDFYYYTLDIAKGLSLISNASDEAEKEGWRVFLFNTDPIIEFKKIKQIKKFLKLIKELNYGK